MDTLVECSDALESAMVLEEIVSRYKSLADIERGFRVLKSEIEIGDRGAEKSRYEMARYSAEMGNSFEEIAAADEHFGG